MALDPLSYMYEDKTITSSSVIQGKDASQLNMDDFFNLLVAQLTNQDMMNPTGDTEFIAQMAQFSSLQGIQTIQEYQLSSYAASYIGKYVTIANVTESGEMETILGKVESITYYEGTPKVVVDGKAYDLFTVMEINNEDGSGGLARATQLKGKEVTIEYVDDDGNDIQLMGTVTNSGIANGAPYVTVNGKNYGLDAISEIEGMPAEEYWDSIGLATDNEADISKMTDDEFKYFFDRFIGTDTKFSNGAAGEVLSVRRDPNKTKAWFMLENGAQFDYDYLTTVNGMTLENFLKNTPVTLSAAAQAMSANADVAQAAANSASSGGASPSSGTKTGINPFTGRPYLTEEELLRENNLDTQREDREKEDDYTRM